MGCNREKGDCVWTLGFSLQYFRHNCLLLALGFHAFLHVLDCKLPRIEDRATFFSCLLPQPPLCQAWAQKRRCQSSAGESPAHLFCILSPAEARATRQHREGPGRKQQSLYTKPTCGYKKEPSLLPPGWARFLGGDEWGRELVLVPGHTATVASPRLAKRHLKRNQCYKERRENVESGVRTASRASQAPSPGTTDSLKAKNSLSPVPLPPNQVFTEDPSPTLLYCSSSSPRGHPVEAPAYPAKELWEQL